MMGVSAKGESKIGAKVALSWLKKAAVGIAVLDLILAINDSRNVGRFFLLITLSSTFDISPENVIRDHCRENVDGICETYAQYAVAGTGNIPAIRSYFRGSGGGGSSGGEQIHSFFGASTRLSHKLLPEMFKELVMSWKSTFDKSRSDANISFLFEDDQVDGMHKDLYSQQSVFQESYLRGKEAVSISNKNHHQLHLNSHGLVDVDSISGSIPIPASYSNSNSSSLPIGRKKRAVLSNRENAEPGNTSGTTVLEKTVSHANTIPSKTSPASAFSVVTSNDDEITATTKTLSTSIPSTIHISTTTTSTDVTTTTTITKGSKSEDVKVKRSKQIRNPNPQQASGDKMNRTTGSDQTTSKGSKNSKSKSSLLTGRDFSKIKLAVGPKQMIGFLQDEMFTRWPFLLENVQTLLKQRNWSSFEQLSLPEATKIKMHIQVRPFGPDPFKDSRQRLKATQQILFDYPWLTMFQLHSRLSGAFTKMFLVISVYTWIWGTVIALMLLIGSLTEDQTTLHGWIIFNILYSLLLFMIDDWIHSNIDPERSSVSIWLFIMYSLYKPLAAWIGFTQWSEMKKIVSLETSKTTTDHYLSSRAMTILQSSSPSSPSILSEGTTTKDTTVVEIITPSKNSLLVSTLAETKPHDLTRAGGGGDSPIEEYEDLDEDDDDDDEETDEDSDDGDPNDIEKADDGKGDG